MTFSAITGRGNSREQTSDTSISHSPSANLTVGKLVFIGAVTDNFPTSDGASSQHTITDSKGNTWTKILEYTETDGVAADGVTVSLHYSIITTQINNTDTITLTCANAVTAKHICCFEVTKTAGTSIQVDVTGVGQGATSASYANAIPGNQQLVVVIGGAEGNDTSKDLPLGYTELFDVRSGDSGDIINTEIGAVITTGLSDGDVGITNWTGTNFMTLMAILYEYNSPADIRASQVGAYVEVSQKQLYVSQVGAYVEAVDAQLHVSQVGAYVEVVTITAATSGPPAQVIIY